MFYFPRIQVRKESQLLKQILNKDLHHQTLPNQDNLLLLNLSTLNRKTRIRSKSKMKKNQERLSSSKVQPEDTTENIKLNVSSIIFTESTTKLLIMILIAKVNTTGTSPTKSSPRKKSVTSGEENCNNVDTKQRGRIMSIINNWKNKGRFKKKIKIQ